MIESNNMKLSFTNFDNINNNTNTNTNTNNNNNKNNNNNNNNNNRLNNKKTITIKCFKYKTKIIGSTR